MSKDRCQNDYNKDLCRYITFWYCQTRHIIVPFVPFVAFRPGKPTPKYIIYLGKVLPASVFALLVVDSGRYGLLYGTHQSARLISKNNIKSNAF